MALKYLQYLGRDGVTAAGEDYFNPIWRDIDGRLDVLERLQISWESAVADLRQFGLERIDATLQPILDQITAAAEEAIAIIGQTANLVTDSEWKWQEPAGSGTYAYTGEQLATITEAISEGRTRVTAYTYDVDGRVQTMTETIGAEAWVTTYTYTDGRLTGVARVAAA